MEKQWTQIFRGIGDTVTLQSKQPSWATCTIFSINLTSISFVFPIFNLPYSIFQILPHLHVLFFSFLLSKQYSDLEPCNPAYKNPNPSIIGAGTFRPFGSLWKFFFTFLEQRQYSIRSASSAYFSWATASYWLMLFFHYIWKCVRLLSL